MAGYAGVIMVEKTLKANLDKSPQEGKAIQF